MSDLVSVDASDEGRVLTATMESPPANALGMTLIDGLEQLCETVERQSPRVLIVRSALDGFFAAGADLKLLGNTDIVGFRDYLVRLRGVLDRLTGLPVVSIAAIDGHALGGGLELAMACTFRVAGPRAKLGVPEIKLGVLPGAMGTQRLPHLIGPGAALDLLLTGRSAGVEEARRLGLVERYCDEGADAAARGLADEVVDFSVPALAAIQRCVRAAIDLPLAQGSVVEADEITQLFIGEDAREGIAAFLEKRPARFQ